jgi:hypothetical protein
MGHDRAAPPAKQGAERTKAKDGIWIATAVRATEHRHA